MLLTFDLQPGDDRLFTDESMEQIERTDELIDAIVYRLYGLSVEEIRIVEGK